MKLAKKYSHVVVRTDAPERIIPCVSLAEAKAHVDTLVSLAVCRGDRPSFSIRERDGETEVAWCHEGGVIVAEGGEP